MTLKELATQHREVARLKFEGRSPTEIATMTGIAIGTVRGILADPLCKAAIEKLNDKSDEHSIDVRRRLSELNLKALNTVEECMDQDISMAVKLSAAKDVLDRNGYKPVEKVNHSHLHLTAEELTSIKERALGVMNLPTEADDICDAEYSETLQ